MTPEGIGTWPRRRRVKSGAHPAIVFRDQVTSYADLADRVAYLGNNHPSLIETLFATTLDAERFVADLSGRLARYKVPRTVEVVDDLPRTASGKVGKNVLRQRHQGR